MAVGLIGNIISPNTAFRWSTYLGVSLWPVCIFVSAKILGLKNLTPATSALFASFIMSVPGVGYEQKGYIWIGYGLWSQLVASWFLPLGLSTAFRGVTNRRFIPYAITFTMLTAAAHFETGYLAFGGIVVVGFLSFKNFSLRMINTAVMLVGSLAMSLWIIFPLIFYKNWTSINEFFTNGPLEKGYGAKIELGWLFTGKMFDYGRLPILTIFAFLGIVVCILNWRKLIVARLLVVLFFAYLVLSFGPTSLHLVANIIPGHSDLFFRRFIIGTDLIAIFVAGFGFDFLISILSRFLNYIKMKVSNTSLQFKTIGTLNSILLVLTGILLAPMFSQLYEYDSSNTFQINNQYSSQISQSKYISPIVSYIKEHESGRTYAGLPTNWGQNFVIGEVQVFKFLEAEDIQEVGYTLRTASLMTDPEAYFNENNPSDYILFGVRYLLLPKGFAPFIKCVHIMTLGNYALWQTPYGFIHLVTTVGNISLNRKDVGVNSANFLNSNLVSSNKELAVNWNSVAGPKPQNSPPNLLGSIIQVNPNLVDGRLAAEVDIVHKSILMLTVSYDPGWTVTVDNRNASIVMLAPAVVGVPLLPGRHFIRFLYVGFNSYPWLFMIMILSFSGVIIFVKLTPSIKKRAVNYQEKANAL